MTAQESFLPNTAENTGGIDHASVYASNELMEGSPKMIRLAGEQRKGAEHGGTDPADDPLDQIDDQTGEELSTPEEFNPNSRSEIPPRSGGIPAK